MLDSELATAADNHQRATAEIDREIAALRARREDGQRSFNELSTAVQTQRGTVKQEGQAARSRVRHAELALDHLIAFFEAT